MLELSDITFSYRRRHPVLRNVTGTVGPGIWLLLGENGAGKTTLLSLISGLLKPESGTCLFDGADTSLKLPSTMRRLFFLPDNLDVPYDTVAELMDYHSHFYPGFSDEVLDEHLHAFGLAGDETVLKLSLGNRHKVLIAYALALGVDLLLLDEPANGLDIQSKKALRSIMAQRIGLDQTVIVSTHNIGDLHDLYDGIIVMHKGRIAVCSKIEDIAMKLTCVRGSGPAEGALYCEQSAGLCSSIIPNTTGEPGLVDYSVLYSAIMSAGAPVLDIINSKSTNND